MCSQLFQSLGDVGSQGRGAVGVAWTGGRGVKLGLPLQSLFANWAHVHSIALLATLSFPLVDTLWLELLVTLLFHSWNTGLPTGTRQTLSGCLGLARLMMRFVSLASFVMMTSFLSFGSTLLNLTPRLEHVAHLNRDGTTLFLGTHSTKYWFHAAFFLWNIKTVVQELFALPCGTIVMAHGSWNLLALDCWHHGTLFVLDQSLDHHWHLVAHFMRHLGTSCSQPILTSWF